MSSWSPGICEGNGYVYVVIGAVPAPSTAPSSLFTPSQPMVYYTWHDGVWGNSGSALMVGGSDHGFAAVGQPACAYDPTGGGTLYVVVQGTGNELYWNSLSVNSGVWSGWVDLNGQSASAPVLVMTPTSSLFSSRIDLFMQSAHNNIYHKVFTSGAWSSWERAPGGGTPSKPAAALYTQVICTSSCSEEDDFIVVVRGMDNMLHYNSYQIFPSQGWGSKWVSLGAEETMFAPALASYANRCRPGSTSTCSSSVDLAITAVNGQVFHTKYLGGTYGWSSSWDSPGTATMQYSPAIAYYPGSEGGFLLLVQAQYGNPNPLLYSTFFNPIPPPWGTYQPVAGGSAGSDPQLVGVF